MTETALTPTATASAARSDPTVGFRRRAGAIALPLGIGGQLVANAVYATVTMSGLGDTGSGAETLEFYRRYATEMQVASVAAMLGALLLVPGLLAAVRVLRTTKPRLSLWAGGLMLAGYLCYFGVVASNSLTVALAQAHLAAGPALDAAQTMWSSIPLFLVFVVGNIGGTALLGIAVLLSRSAVPRIAGVLILAWPLAHVTGLIVGSEWIEVAGGSLEVIGLCFLTAAALRTPNDEWVRRG
ncbi:hypothetical protein [Leifsonia poae]|uniref:hypothetical protein n=1 Tax=Leifsonia poae TaxID=110933 RepID=UPI001CBC49C3|nr:hypothetical protein [Leifsonia poae]